MASTSSSSITSSPQNHTRFDVFLSFRGEDTRHTFTDHLFHALKQAGLRTFRDDDEIGRGEELKPEIESAIIQSRASIVVLSENYAKSKWCLDELWLILDQRRKNNHFVLPVFYHVDPSDVRNQRGSFAIQVEEGLLEGSKWTKDNVNRWKAALKQVANLTGMVVSGSETDFIEKVVDTAYRKLDLKLLSTPTHQIGIETRAQVINSWLKDGQSGTNVLAICGMGGGGKTTLAQYIYNCNKQNFNSSSFIEEIWKHSKQPYDLIGLQKQLLGDVLGRKNPMISSVSEGTRKIEEVLEMKRVLIVLDDIDEPEQLDALLGGKTLHTQSKIIITTRLLDIGAWFGSISWRYRVDKVELLNDLESLELFSWHAFGSKFPMAGFEKLAVQLTQYCAGNPLALKVLGSSLFIGADQKPSQRNSLLEIWACRLKSLSSLKGNVDSKIQGVLQRSFDSLPYNNDKELFLHVACFLVDQLTERVVDIFEADLHARSGIMTLTNRCLLTVSSNGLLKMHRLLQDMGRRVVCDESKDPAGRSRVWCSDEAYNLLSKGDGSKKTEGLFLTIEEVKEGTMRPLAALEAGSLVKMKNLKLLRLIGAQLVGPYKNFPDLRWLCWGGSNLKTIPSGLLTSRLVVLELMFGKLEKFEPPTVLNSLKTLSLDFSFKLVSVGGFSLLPKLETLSLQCCSSLTHICKTLGDLKSLYSLELTGCVNLLEASLNKYGNLLQRLKDFLGFGGIQEQQLLFIPQSLNILLLEDCGLLFNNGVGVVFHSQSLLFMSLRANPFDYLPHNINLKVLRALRLTSCPNLKSLPCLPNTIQKLYVDWCTSLESITFQSARFSLEKFDYEACFSLSEIQGLFKLVSIAKLNEADLGDMRWIKAYQHHKVDLVGDVITKGRSWHIQMLYEYGIRSTYLQGIKDQSMMTYEYTSSSDFLSFHVPLYPKKYRIKGLNVTCLYSSLNDKGGDMTLLFVKISNITKGLTWAYNPVVYCRPKVDEDVVWLSYWPIGNILDEGDEVNVLLFTESGRVLGGCGASLVYINGEVGEEEKCENYTSEEEVIGGDLSEFEVAKGGYYLCRRDFMKSKTTDWLKCLFGGNIHYTNSEGWRQSRQSRQTRPLGLRAFKESLLARKIEVGVSHTSRSEMDKIEEALSSIAGVDSVSVYKEIGRIYVIGCVDLEEVETRLRKFEMVKIINC